MGERFDIRHQVERSKQAMGLNSSGRRYLSPVQGRPTQRPALGPPQNYRRRTSPGRRKSLPREGLTRRQGTQPILSAIACGEYRYEFPRLSRRAPENNSCYRLPGNNEIHRRLKNRYRLVASRHAINKLKPVQTPMSPQWKCNESQVIGIKIPSAPASIAHMR